MASDWAVVAAGVGAAAVTSGVPSWLAYRADKARRAAEADAASKAAAIAAQAALRTACHDVLAAASPVMSWNGPSMTKGASSHADLMRDLIASLQLVDVLADGPLREAAARWLEGVNKQVTSDHAADFRAAMRAAGI